MSSFTVQGEHGDKDQVKLLPPMSLCLLVSLIFPLASLSLMHRLCSLSIIVPEGNWFTAENRINTKRQNKTLSKNTWLRGMKEYLCRSFFILDSWNRSYRQPKGGKGVEPYRYVEPLYHIAHTDKSPPLYYTYLQWWNCSGHFFSSKC